MAQLESQRSMKEATAGTTGELRVRLCMQRRALLSSLQTLLLWTGVVPDTVIVLPCVIANV